MSSVSGDFPIQPATRLSDRSAGCLPRCIVLPVCPCVVSFSKFHEPDAHDLLQTSHGDPDSILARYLLHARFSLDMLATFSRVCHEDATRKLLRWNLSYKEEEREMSAPCSPCWSMYGKSSFALYRKRV